MLVTDYLDKHCSGQNICVLSCFDSGFYDIIGSGWRRTFSMTDTIPCLVFFEVV